MIQTPTEQVSHIVCEACKQQHDLTSWQSLRPCSVGVQGRGQETATYIVQTRYCTCGATITIQFPLPAGTTPLAAECLLALSVLGPEQVQSESGGATG